MAQSPIHSTNLEYPLNILEPAGIQTLASMVFTGEIFFPGLAILSFYSTPWLTATPPSSLSGHTNKVGPHSTNYGLSGENVFCLSVSGLIALLLHYIINIH